jgi:cell division protein FtsN
MTALPALAAAPSPAPAAQAQPPAPAPPAPTPVAASPAPPQPEPAAPPAPPRTVSLPPVTPPSAEIAPPAPASAARRANAIVARAAHWVVQIGAYKSMEAATKIFAGIADPKVALEPGPGRMWRVFLGPFADKAAARLKAKELSARGYSTQIHEERK